MGQRGCAILALLAVLAPGAVARAGDGTIAGSVTAAGSGRAGVAIEVYLERRKSAGGGAPFAVTESGEGGGFEIALPAGEYYLWARSAAPTFGPPLVTEYPANPVRVGPGKVTLLPPIALREAGRGDAAPAPKGTGVRGRVTAGGVGAADASVMVYAGASARLTGPGYVASMLTGPDGRFEADLPPGRYRVTARRRADGAVAGFLRPGDLSAEFAGNPVAVEPGKYADLGDLALHDVDPARLEQRELERRTGAGPTRLSGKATDGDGRPLAGQYVFVYRDQGMIGRPDLMAVTGADGSFLFDLPGGGTWYVGARSTMGGPRQPGEMAGRLSGTADSSVVVRAGEARAGLVVRMEEVW